WWQLLPRYISEPDLEEKIENAKIDNKSALNILSCNGKTVDISHLPIPGLKEHESKNIEDKHTHAGVMTNNLQSLDLLAHNHKLDKLRHLKGARQGSMSKGLVVVEIKDQPTKDCATKSVEQLQSIVSIGNAETRNCKELHDTKKDVP
ncbi:hypothetical protein HK100_006403, partial [Physocladia obscura]